MIKVIKSLVEIYRLYGNNIFATIRHIRLNYFSKNIHSKGGHLYIYPNVQLSLHSTSVIELWGNMYIGVPTVKGSKTISRLVMGKFSRFAVNKKCDIFEGCDIQILKNGTFTVDDFHSNIDLEILCGNQIRFIGNVTAGRHVRLKDYNGHQVSYDGYPFSKAVIVEDHVWICTGASINPGTHIESGAVIADNANVNGRIKEGSFVQGNPAVIVKENVKFNI